MAIERLRRRLTPWLEGRFGASPEALATADIPVVALDARLELAPPVFAVALGGRGVVTTRPDWEAAVRGALDGLTYDLLFSIYGAYELSRATLPHGFTGWGPYFCMAADAESFRTVDDARPVYLSADELRSAADPQVFWHCFVDEAIGGFGIFAGGNLVSLAAVRVESDELLEIGIDSAPDQQPARHGESGCVRGGALDPRPGQARLVDDLDLERPFVAARPCARPGARLERDDRGARAVSHAAAAARRTGARRRDASVLPGVGHEQRHQAACRLAGRRPRP